MGGRGVTLSQFIIKVHSRCDLACDHCYVYTKADQSWSSRPRVISEEVVARTADRIAEHARSHRLDDVRVVLHGGEPLLAGRLLLGRLLSILREALSSVPRLDIRIHTNGLLLDEKFCDLFAEHGVRVGVSLDGDRRANDLHRRHADGRSSYDQVSRALRLLQSRPEVYGGILCTIDLANDPAAVYRALLQFEPPHVDFLLPHATWDDPPPRPPGRPAPYADWLLSVFRLWEEGGRPVDVRLFNSIIRTTHGKTSLTEAIGLQPSALAVIETDGSYEQVDSLKVAYEGAAGTGMNVFSHDLDAVAAHPGVAARRTGLSGLSRTCRECPVVSSCGGGLYPHRYRFGSGFDQPSVFCPDLYQLITKVRGEIKMQRHILPGHTLDALARGLGGEQDIRWLAASQRSLQRALMTTLRTREDARAAWDVLVDLEARAPDETRRVLAHPYVRAWAVECVKGTSPARYLANIAAAAAVRAGAETELRVQAHDGFVHLPTVATLGPVPGETALLSAGPDGILLDGRETACRPVRTLTSETGYEILLEDSDPYRDCHQWPVAPPLTDEQASAWQTAFDAAWRLVEKEYPGYAEGIRAGLNTLTVLAPPPPGREASSAARQAFGAVAAALPGDPATLALLLMHEFQHVKLGAVLDLFDLYDETDLRRFPAPWRDDPRPLEGLLQGTYAHLAVTDFWRVHEPRGERFQLWGGHTARAVETLAGSGSLTPLGDLFVGRMREAVTRMLAEPGGAG